MQDEYHWLSNVESLFLKEQLDKADYPSWAGHFTLQQTPNTKPDAITALMPLFVERAHSLTMIQVSKRYYLLVDIFSKWPPMKVK